MEMCNLCRLPQYVTPTGDHHCGMATFIVHWPGKDVPACARHQAQLQGVASTLGCNVVSVAILNPTHALNCTNCENEARKFAESAEKILPSEY